MAWTDEQLADVVAADIADGWYVNLGVGLPTLVAERLMGRPVLVHAENGILGVGPPPEGQEDPDIIDPGKNPVTIVPGAAFMDSLISFSIIRGGHLDLSVMGAFQVSARGDLANWRLPGRKGGAIGGAADLAAGSRRVWVMTTHTTKDGEPKLVTDCGYPLTAIRVVTRVYSDLAVMDVTDGRFRVVRLAPGIGADEVRAKTGAEIELAIED
jgi:3-oxoacid CoA-transferase subunit B